MNILADGGALALKTVAAPATTKSVPILVVSLGGYNVVEYEAWHYGLPRALGPLDLDQTDAVCYGGASR